MASRMVPASQLAEHSMQDRPTPNRHIKGCPNEGSMASPGHATARSQLHRRRTSTPACWTSPRKAGRCGRPIYPVTQHDTRSPLKYTSTAPISSPCTFPSWGSPGNCRQPPHPPPHPSNPRLVLPHSTCRQHVPAGQQANRPAAIKINHILCHPVELEAGPTAP